MTEMVEGSNPLIEAIIAILQDIDEQERADEARPTGESGESDDG
jgi:hypothetical protein